MLKLSSVTPIFKSGNVTDVSNYRPIFIQRNLSKLLESIVLHFAQPSVNNILCDEQHGFRHGHSTLTCNMVFTKFALDAFSNHF